MSAANPAPATVRQANPPWAVCDVCAPFGAHLNSRTLGLRCTCQCHAPAASLHDSTARHGASPLRLGLAA